MSPRLTRFWPIAALLGAMFSIQSSASIAKHIFPWVGAAGATTLRLSVSLVLLSIAWRPWRYCLARSDLKYVVGYGASLGAMNFFFYLSITRIPLGTAVALEFMGPLAVALCTSRRVADFAWAGFAALGILLLSPLAGPMAAIDPLGALYSLAAAGGWAGYILFGKRAGRNLPGGVVTTLGMVVAAVLVFPWGVPRLLAGPPLWQVLPWAVGLALFSSALPYTLEMVALQRLETKSFSVLMSMEPAVAALSGLLLLGEHLVWSQWVAITCIIVASLGSAFTFSRPSTQVV